jgi:hypothetical protein
MMKRHPIRVIEISVHRSRKNPKLGHAVALLFPCNHNKYLGITLFKGDSDTNQYRTQTVRIIRFEDYDIMDKEVCKLCPQDEYWLDDLTSEVKLDDFVDVLEAIDDL